MFSLVPFYCLSGEPEWKNSRKLKQPEIDEDRWEGRDAAKDTDRNSNSELIGCWSPGWIEREIHTPSWVAPHNAAD